jgi:hypothetical protein
MVFRTEDGQVNRIVRGQACIDKSSTLDGMSALELAPKKGRISFRDPAEPASVLLENRERLRALALLLLF